MDGTTPEGESQNTNSTVVFGAFELQLDTGELRKHGVRVRLQGKPFQILRALLERPGHVVTREELRAKLWSSHTFVDFESGLNTAVNRLRMALGDSAENPIYVETLSRIGYRFVGPVSQAAVVSQETESRAHDAGEAALGRKQPGTPDAATKAPGRRRFVKSRGPLLAGAAALIIAVFGIAVFKGGVSQTQGSFHEVTFQRGFVNNARFARGGMEIVYSASWNGKPSHLFRSNTISPEAKELAPGTAWLASVSRAGDLAVFKLRNEIGSKDVENMECDVELARGGERHIASDHVKGADWGPNGALALVTEKDSTYSIEYPAGHKLYTSNGWIDGMRVGPAGDQIAFVEHPIPDDDGGQVVVVNSGGEARVLSSGWGSVSGLAWHPSGSEVWFTAARSGVDRVLMAVDRKKHVRQVAQIPGGLQLMDIDPSGTVLIARTTPRMTMLLGGDNVPLHDISLLDWSRAVAMTPDGKQVLFDESGEGGGQRYSAYLYHTDTSASERVGEGRAMDVSPDGRWVLTQAADDATKLFLISAHDHKTTPVENHGLEYRWAKFIPGSECQEILFEGNASHGRRQIYRQELPRGTPAVLGGGLRLEDAVVDGSGHIAAGVNDDFGLVILDLIRGTTRSLPIKKHVPLVFASSREVITSYRDKGAVRLEMVDVQSGQLRNCNEVNFGDSADSPSIFHIHVSRDLRKFVYSRHNVLSNLYTVSGWK